MNFTVTYRSAGGAMVTEVVEAANRADCFSRMKARGIVPVSVKDDGARGRVAATSASKRPPAASGGVKGRSNSLVGKVVLAAVVLAVAGVGVWLWIDRESVQPPQAPETPKKSGLAKEVKPASAPKPVAETPKDKAVTEKTKEIDTVHYREECHTNMYGYVINAPSSRVVFTNGNDEAHMSIGERVFKNTAEQKIADLLTMAPGDMLVGDSSSLYGRGFARQLRKAAENPPVIEEDDTEDVKDLKRAVREATLDLKKRMDAGEDAGEIMKSLRDEMQNLALYRRDLEKEVSQLAKREDMTEADLKDFVEAANQMLSERGAKPLTMPRFAARRLMRLQKSGVK